MGMGLINRIIPPSKYKWKAFCETTSTRSDWVIGNFISNVDTKWKAIDKVTGAVIDSGTHPKNTYHLQINLSNNTNGAIIYLKVDKNGNGIDTVWFWYYDHELNWVDIDVLPMLGTFWISGSQSQITEVKNVSGTNRLTYIEIGGNVKLKNIYFINNAEHLVYLVTNGSYSFENGGIINSTKWKNTLKQIKLGGTNIGYDTFDFSDFNVLDAINFERHFNLQDANGTNILLPKDTLKYLYNYKVNTLFPQFGVDTFSLLYYFYTRINNASYDYNKLLSNGNLFPELYQIYINVKMATADTLVKDFPKLGKFIQYGGVDANGTIEFRNNPKLWYPILNGTKYTNVILDTVSQQAITRFNYVYPYASLDLSQANLLAYIQYSHRLVTGLKLNIRNGNNQNLAQFYISKYYEDSCIICDDDCFDSNGDLALPIMVNADKRAGDVFTTDPNDANCPT